MLCVLLPTCLGDQRVSRSRLRDQNHGMSFDLPLPIELSVPGARSPRDTFTLVYILTMAVLVEILQAQTLIVVDILANEDPTGFIG